MNTYGIMKKVHLIMGIEAAAVLLLFLGMGWRSWDIFVLLFVLLLAQYLPVAAAISEEQEKEIVLDREAKNFPGGRLLWKRIGRKAVMAVLLLVLGGVLSVLFRAFYGYGIGYYGSELIAHNSNAKLAYTNTATYLTKLEARGTDPSDMDGTYWGSLQKEHGRDCNNWPADMIDSSGESFDYAMKYLMGSERAEVAGCYYVVIKGGRPVQVFWSKSNELLYYAERYAERFGQGEVEGDFYIGGDHIGSYPTAVLKAVKTPPEWLRLTSSDRMRIRIKDLRKNYFFYIIFIAPLIIYLIVRLMLRFGNKPKKETPALENV